MRQLNATASEAIRARALDATPEFFGVSFASPTVFEVKRGKDLAFTVRSAVPQRLSHYEIVRGASANRSASAFECSGGWVVVKEREHPHSNARDNYGGPSRLGAKLAPLADGDLVVGQWVRVVDRRGSILSWGDAHVGNIRLPDQVYWRWARFEKAR